MSIAASFLRSRGLYLHILPILLLLLLLLLVPLGRGFEEEGEWWPSTDDQQDPVICSYTLPPPRPKLMLHPRNRYSVSYGHAACWPSTGGVWDKRVSHAEREWLGLSRFVDTPRSDGAGEEDAFCARLRSLGASWWPQTVCDSVSDSDKMPDYLFNCDEPDVRGQIQVGVSTQGHVWAITNREMAWDASEDPELGWEAWLQYTSYIPFADYAAKYLKDPPAQVMEQGETDTKAQYKEEAMAIMQREEWRARWNILHSASTMDERAKFIERLGGALCTKDSSARSEACSHIRLDDLV